MSLLLAGKATVTTSIRGCTTDFGKQMVRYSSFQKISTGKITNTEDPDYDPSNTRPEYVVMWFPKVATREGFMWDLHASFKAHAAHVFEKQWHQLHQRRVMDECIHKFCAGVGDPRHRNSIVTSHDFAAAIKLSQLAVLTAVHIPTSQMFVWVLHHDPRLAHTADLPAGRLKSRLTKAGVISYHYCDTTILYVLSGANNNAQFYNAAAIDGHEVIHTGRAPPGCPGSWFHNGERLANSNCDAALDPGLAEQDPAVPSKPIIKSGGSGVSIGDWRARLKEGAESDCYPSPSDKACGDDFLGWRPPADLAADRTSSERVTLEEVSTALGFDIAAAAAEHRAVGAAAGDADRAAFAAAVVVAEAAGWSKVERSKIWEFRDGCSKQYQGLHGFYTVMLRVALWRSTCKSVCCPAGDGKGPHDGAGKHVTATILNAALRGDNASPTIESMVQLLARFTPRPSVPRQLKTAITGHSNYVYGCYPDDGSGFPSCYADKGYTGSSKDYFYESHPSNFDPSDSWLLVSKKPCPCVECMAGNYDGCLVKHLYAWDKAANKTRRYQLAPHTPDAARAKSKRLAMEQFAKKMKMGIRVGVRVHPDEANTEREQFFVGLAIAEPGGEVAWKTKSNGILSMNAVPRDTWVVRVRWYHHKPEAQCPADMPGALGYELVENEAAAVLQLEATMQSSHNPLQRMVYRGGTYWLKAEDYEEIILNVIDLLA